MVCFWAGTCGFGDKSDVSDAGGGFNFFVLWVEGAGFDVPSQTEEAEGGDSVPIGIELVPGEAVTGGLGVGVVVVVPAFAKCEESYPQAVAGGVACGEAA